MVANICFTDCPENRIRDRMAEDIRVAMAVETMRVGNHHAAEDEGTAFGEGVHIIANADEVHSAGRSSILPFHARTETLSGKSARVVISKLPPAFSRIIFPAATSHNETLCSR